MKTNNQIEFSPRLATRRGISTPTAVASLAIAAATLPAVAGNESGTASKGDPTAIRSFDIRFSDEALADLRRRIAGTIWPEKETVTDTSQGVQLATMQKLARYWAGDYDWRKCEAKLNALPQFTTEIDGLDIHFIHATSRHEDALPLIITHGWPGSVIELLEVAGPLTDPAAHGTAAPPRTRPILSSRRCPAAGSPASRRRSAGIPAVPRGPGRS
jgi:hypothetical protein